MESSQEERDIIKEFVDQSFDRDKESGNRSPKGMSPKQELENCLKKINVEITGKILETKNRIVSVHQFL